MPEYATNMKPVIPDYDWSIFGVRVKLLRENILVARCTVARLMKAMGLAWGRRGKKVRTTVSQK
ncbi:hypothetical protein NUKP32_55620 [Klebsiella variicola]|nr:hypothetical protein NUKP32_55620 [Klebsiella variicola]